MIKIAKKQVRVFREVAAGVGLNGELFVINKRFVDARASPADRMLDAIVSG